VLLSELRTEGKAILNDIYGYVLRSNDKDIWKKAIDSIFYRIHCLEYEAREASIKDWESSNEIIKKLWCWQEARYQILQKFGSKFIKPTLSPHAHEKTAKPVR